MNLLLTPGEDTVNAHIGAFSSYEGDFGFCGQASAEFSLKIVREPGAEAPCLAGTDLFKSGPRLPRPSFAG